MALFSCPFCNENTRGIPHNEGDHLAIAKCEFCDLMLFFVFSKTKKEWAFRNYERPKEQVKK